MTLAPDHTLAAPRATAAPAAPGRHASRRDRDPWFDNAKMLLICLVVVGHSWTLLPEKTFVNLSYDWLYLWHIPAFVMVTGYLSRRFTFSAKNLRRLVTTVVVPYLVFEGLFALFRVYVGGETLERLWLNPHWPMWYLAALFFWRLATPFFRRTAQPLALAVAVSLLGGILGIETFDLSRVMGLLPFFVAGLVVEDRHLEWLRSTGARRIDAGRPRCRRPRSPRGIEWGISTEWLYYRTSYGDLNESWISGMAIRALLLLLSSALALAALAWVPRRGGWFARLGAGSLVVYLFHGFFVMGAEYAGYPGWADQHAALSFAATSVVALVVALTLSWRPVRKPLQKVVTPVT